jgi:hypothetical protein
VDKSSPRISTIHFCNFQKKLPEENNRLKGENLPNLVTLIWRRDERGATFAKDFFLGEEQGDQMSLLKNAQNVAQSTFLSKLIHDFNHGKM